MKGRYTIKKRTLLILGIIVVVFGVVLGTVLLGIGGIATTAYIETTEGTIVLELDADASPITVENFIRYVEDGFYDGTVFHRVISGFMIQGGGFTSDGEMKDVSYAPISNEAANGLRNERGTIAMARTMFPHSATSQFFINVVDNPALDYVNEDNYGYAVFGRVVEGMDVVDAIAAVPTTVRAPHQDWPEDDIQILSVRVR